MIKKRRNKQIFWNKKSVDIVPEALVRTVVTVGFVLVVYLFGSTAYANTIKPYFSEKKYVKSFDDFINNINNMEVRRDTFGLKLGQNTAVIGFSKDIQKYECINCYNIGVNVRTVTADKPNDKECIGQACICLCSEGLRISESGAALAVIGCQKYTCKKIVQKDIAKRTAIEPLLVLVHPKQPPQTYPRAWINGFLYSNNFPNANGLKVNNEEAIELVVERKDDVIGVCNRDALKYNKNVLGSEACITE